MTTEENPFPIQSFYVFQTKEDDPITSFEQLTQLRVKRNEIVTVPIEKDVSKLMGTKKSLWDSFWEDGWSHVTFGSVSTGVGIGLLFVVSGPIGWGTAVLAIGGGASSIISGGGQLLSSDPETKELFAQVGDASLSLNNIPGFTVGAATFLLTENYGQAIDYANIAGLVGGGVSIANSGMKAIKMQRLYNLEVGLKNTAWGSRTRGINAMIMGVNPKGLEGSHLIPQRMVRTLSEKLPRYKRDIENLANGPLGIKFVTSFEHALVDPYRYRTLPLASKEALAATDPFKVMLLKNYPKMAQVFGFHQNMSQTARPLFNSIAITSGRVVKQEAVSSSRD